jgi:phosphoribosylformylglycinamidine synthase
MGDACRALDYPIVSGNVSLYNESKATGGGSAILPTPAIGGVGLMDDHEKMATIGFKRENEMVFLLGQRSPDVGQSLWLRECHELEAGMPPPVDLAIERRLGELVRDLISRGAVSAVHDVSDGGLLVAVAEMALAGNIGVVVDPVWLWTCEHLSGELFGESQARYVVSARVDDIENNLVVELARKAGVPCSTLGQVDGDSVFVGDLAGPVFADVPLTALREASDSFFRDWMES